MVLFSFLFGETWLIVHAKRAYEMSRGLFVDFSHFVLSIFSGAF